MSIRIGFGFRLSTGNRVVSQRRQETRTRRHSERKEKKKTKPVRRPTYFARPTASGFARTRGRRPSLWRTWGRCRRSTSVGRTTRTRISGRATRGRSRPTRAPPRPTRAPPRQRPASAPPSVSTGCGPATLSRGTGPRRAAVRQPRSAAPRIHSQTPARTSRRTARHRRPAGSWSNRSRRRRRPAGPWSKTRRETRRRNTAPTRNAKRPSASCRRRSPARYPFAVRVSGNVAQSSAPSVRLLLSFRRKARPADIATVDRPATGSAGARRRKRNGKNESGRRRVRFVSIP